MAHRAPLEIFLNTEQKDSTLMSRPQLRELFIGLVEQNQALEQRIAVLEAWFQAVQQHTTVQDEAAGA